MKSLISLGALIVLVGCSNVYQDLFTEMRAEGDKCATGDQVACKRYEMIKDEIALRYSGQTGAPARVNVISKTAP